MFWSFLENNSTQWKPIEAKDFNIKAPTHEKSKISPYCSCGVIQVPGRLGHPLDSDVNVTVMLLAKTSTVLLLASSMFMEALVSLPNQCMCWQNWQCSWGKMAFCQKHVSISRQAELPLKEQYRVMSWFPFIYFWCVTTQGQWLDN